MKSEKLPKQPPVASSEQLELIHHIIENIPHMIFVKDAEHLRFVLFNRAGEELLGYSREELIGKNDFDFFPHPQAVFFTQKDREIIKSIGVMDIPEEKIMTRLQGERILHTKKMAVRDSQGRPLYLLGISVDVTKQKAQEQKMMVSAKLSTLGQMAGGIAHEINNPLAIVLGFAEEITRTVQSGEMDRKRLGYVAGRIAATAGRIARVVRGLRAVARDMDDDPMEWVPVSRLIEDAVDLCGERFRHHAIRLERSQVTIDLNLYCRPVQISQILLNLLSNAFDAVSGLEDKWVKIEVTENDKKVVIRVSDSGGGVPTQILDRIFDPFFTTKDVGAGTGLGLSISKGLVESNLGTLYYDRTAPNTCFVLEFPKRKRA